MFHTNDDPQQPVQDAANLAVSVLAVVVLYHKAIDESAAVRSLCACASRAAHPAARIKILIHDNTPGEGDPGVLPANVEYHRAPRNLGIAAAYNRALAQAVREGCGWLLTLDHDTTLPEDFLHRITKVAIRVAPDARVAAIVPRIVHGEHTVSPMRIVGHRSLPLPESFAGIADAEISAINSATLWRVSALQQIGGFHPLFWLDMLDAWTFHTLQHAGKRVYVAGDVKVEHDLSLMSRDTAMSPARFDNYLQALSAFYDLCKSRASGIRLTLHLTATLLSQIRRHSRPELRRSTWKYLSLRLFSTRAQRIALWKQEASAAMDRLP